MRLFASSAPDAQRGNATVISVIVLFVIGSLAAVVLTVSQRHTAEIAAMADQNRAFMAAQSGVNDVLGRLEDGEYVLDEGDVVSIGTEKAPLSLSGIDYWADVSRAGSLFTVTTRARSGLQEKALEVVAQQQSQGVFQNGIFAGNSSGDPGYTLDLSGVDTQADQIYGDVYSGGSVSVREDAQIHGTIRAKDGVSGNGAGSAETGIKQGIPDIAGRNYEATAEIQVAAEFAAGGSSYKSNSAGGSAWQLPESNPAHIFRKNPSDRTSETSSTPKDDYFLEDPYEKVKSDSSSDGTNAYEITLAGVNGKSGTNSNQKVFFIDGNLWIHNYKTMSLKFGSGGSGGMQATFVVKGNIYISDNLFYSDRDKDGVAFIAMKDSKVADSGNVYFGDPKLGTLERMYAYLYAENDFLDVNLSATGSARVELYGNMTAGNQVKIRRDYVTTVGGKKVIQHSKLMVDFDERLADGDLSLPGLPTAAVSGSLGFDVLSWREVER